MQKKKKEEEIDVSTLPPWLPILMSLHYTIPIKRAKIIQEKLQSVLKDRYRLITREEVIQYAIEKGLYANPNAIPEKGKKKEAVVQEIPQELTPEILAQSFNKFLYDLDIQGRKAKLDKIEGVVPKQQNKKDSKEKNSKKQVEVKEEEEKIPEKDFPKASDIFYVLQDYPQTKEEYLALSQLNLKIDTAIEVNQKVVRIKQDILLDQSVQNENLKQRLEQFADIDGANELNEVEEQEDLTPEDQKFNEKNQENLRQLKEARELSSKDDCIRNTVLKEICVKVDLENEVESLSDFVDFLHEDISEFSFDLVSFQEWSKDKQTFKYEQNQDIVKEDIKEASPQFNMDYYNKQLTTVKEDNIGPGVLLECLIDQISIQHNQGVMTSIREFEQAQLDKIFTSTFDSINNTFISKKETYNELHNIQHNIQLLIIDEADEIQRRTLQSKLNNQDSLNDREKQIQKKILFPGINRQQMPSIPTKSANLRKSERSQYYPFISCEVSEFERKMLIKQFEYIIRDKQPQRKWDFGDRIYQERHDKNTLSQILWDVYLSEADIISEYDENNDRLLMLAYYKNPKGNILYKKWVSPWRVLPNFENWLKHFKNDQQNLHGDNFYDVDYNKSGNLKQMLKMLYLSDNSLILFFKISVGNNTFHRQKIIKDSLVFGIRNSANLKNNFTFSQEFWASFNNQTKLLVELVSSSPQELNQNLIQSQQYDFSLTLTLVCGLVVKFYSNGDILQTLVKGRETEKKEEGVQVIVKDQENNRLITGKGSVIKYMADGSIQILYANGNVAVNKKNGVWVSTNNKGQRKGKIIQNGSEFELDGIPCASKADPETGCRILIREDGVMVIKYKDGSVFTQHKDGTKIHSSPQQNNIVIEHPDYATIQVRFDEHQQSKGQIINDQESGYLGEQDIIQRSYDGRITYTYLPDGTQVIGFKELKQQSNYQTYQNYVYLLYGEDNTVIKAEQNGEIVLLNSNDYNKETPQNYFNQVFGIQINRKGGVYTAQLTEGLLWTRDDELNLFEIYTNGVVNVIRESSQEHNKNDNDKNILRPSTPDFEGQEYVDPQYQQLAEPTNQIPPRLFVINNDNTGRELFCEDQLKYYFSMREQNPNLIKIIEQNVPGIAECESVSYFTEFKQQEEKQKILINAEIPRNIDILPKTYQKQIDPIGDVYLYRNLLRYQYFGENEKQLLEEDLIKFQNWKKTQLKEIKEFGILKREKIEKEKDSEIQHKIIQSRQTNYDQETFSSAKNQSIEKFLKLLQDQQEVIKQTKIEQEQLEEIQRQQNLNKQKVKKKKEKIQQQPVQDYFLDDQEELKKNGFDKSNSEPRLNNDELQFKVDYTLLCKGFVPSFFQTKEGIILSRIIPPADATKLTKKKRVQYPDEVLDAYSNKSIKDIKNLTASERLGGSSNNLLDQQQVQQEVPPNEEGYEKNGDAQDNYNNFKFTQKNLSKRTKELGPPRESYFSSYEKNYQQAILDQEREALEFQKKKTKDYDVYGRTRMKSEKVPVLLRTNPIAELNQQYISIESPVDKRVKISSLKGRVHLKAPSIEAIRKQDNHQLLASTLDKKNKFSDLLEKRNLMITAEMTEPLKRDILIKPITVNFGLVKAGVAYEKKVVIKNEDYLEQRINLKQPKNTYFKVMQEKLGPIATGIDRDIIIKLYAQDHESFQEGLYNDEFQIITKHNVYKIPINANILSPENFDKIEKEKPLSRKSMKKPQTVEESFDNPSIEHHNYMESINSDSNFKVPYFEKNVKLNMNPIIKKKPNEKSYDASY